jgi:hypothetical protein
MEEIEMENGICEGQMYIYLLKLQLSRMLFNEARISQACEYLETTIKDYQRNLDDDPYHILLSNFCYELSTMLMN